MAVLVPRTNTLLLTLGTRPTWKTLIQRGSMLCPPGRIRISKKNISNSTNFSQNPHWKICERSTIQSQHDRSPIQVCKYQMKKYELWGWYPNIQISIETIWVSKLNNKISGSLRNVQPMPLTICRRLTQASEPITALTSSIMLLQHWSTSNSNNQWTILRRHLLPADGNVRRCPTTVDRRPFPF